jgi:2-keto-4-pentenoate hydratase/2-oxohepta-3-ene-1,7-dioic acid hydratase in catechol pathway
VFNEASVRDYQTKGPQWTLGKNFDNTGGFGPVFVTADELPPGGKGLRLQTRLNGQVVQTASTDDMIFDVATIIAFITEAITLAPGDIIITGTPAGVGMARKPQLFMKPGDVCEVELERVGLLRNPIQAEAPLGGQQAA